MTIKDFSDKAIRWTARMLSEPDGQGSSRRVVMVASIFAALFFSAGLMLKHPEMTVDLVKYVITAAVTVYGVTKGAEIAKG